MEGPTRFVRYAFPPNLLGYCGPHDHRAVFEYGVSGTVDRGLAQLAAGFHGAWPYLELLAAAAGTSDPLDWRVVEAYWVGNPLLDRVPLVRLATSVGERFRPRSGPGWDRLAAALRPGAVPHHSFHVLAVYPWVGMLRTGATGEPLRVLDRCRIRWGEVVAVEGDEVVVSSRPLAWDGVRLYLDAPRVERAQHARQRASLAGALQPGDRVALHWDWVCERLDGDALRRLITYSRRQLDLVNRSPVPAPAVVLS